jgi:hypothetical protein
MMMLDVGIALAALLVETAILIATLVSLVHPLVGVGCHLAVIYVLYLVYQRFQSAGAQVRFSGLLLVSTAALGPVGPLGTLFTKALTYWYERSSTPFDEWYESLFPETTRDGTVEFLEKVLLADGGVAPGGVAAFTDILAFGSISQKQALLALVSRGFRPEFGPVLKLAVQDSENAVRVQAATAIGKLESAFLERGLASNRRLEERPEDPAILNELGSLYDEYAYSGILDARREYDNREIALTYYQRALLLRKDPPVLLAVARLLLRNKRHAEAGLH